MSDVEGLFPFIDRIDEIQSAHAAWQAAKFPGFESWECLLGAQEELGELARAHLKAHEITRYGANRAGLDEEALARAARDAVGDVVLFLMGYCNARGWRFSDCVREAWREVEGR